MAIRTTVTRYRAGDSLALAISPCWLTVSSGVSRREFSAPVVAWIRLRESWDVEVGDLLRAADGRVFVVRQIAPEQATSLLACGELSSLIPDEFCSGIVEGWWTNEGGAKFTRVAGTGYLTITTAGDGASMLDPAAQALLGQTLTGDFDVWCQLEQTSAPNPGAGPRAHWLYLGARLTSTQFVGVGLYATGLGGSIPARLDQQAPGNQALTPFSAGTTPDFSAYCRLKKCGSEYLAFYAPGSAIPSAESDWVVSDLPSLAQKYAGLVTVGLGGHVNFTTAGAGRCAFIRNWQSIV